MLALRAWHPLEVTAPILEAAWDAQDRWRLSFLDSLIDARLRVPLTASIIMDEAF